MPTFVAAKPGNRRHDAGFTLVELLVVLAVLGLLAGVVIWRLPIGNDRARSDAVTFATRLAASRDQAILSGRPQLLQVDPQGYRFEERVQGDWRPTSEPSLRDRRWSEGVRIDLASPTLRIRFDGVGMPDSALRVRLRDPDSSVVVELQANGELSVS